jgi:hypothetical protein
MMTVQVASTQTVQAAMVEPWIPLEQGGFTWPHMTGAMLGPGSQRTDRRVSGRSTPHGTLSQD